MVWVFVVCDFMFGAGGFWLFWLGDLLVLWFLGGFDVAMFWI